MNSMNILIEKNLLKNQHNVIIGIKQDVTVGIIALCNFFFLRRGEKNKTKNFDPTVTRRSFAGD